GKAANPPTGNMFVPTPNHDHVVDNSRVDTGPIWWEVRPVLIMDQSDWPAPDGSSGITSSRAMDDAEAAGRAIEVGSNFFLFFTSRLGATSTAVHGDHSAHMAAAHGTGNATQPLPSVRSVAADHYPAEEHVSGAAGTRV